MPHNPEKESPRPERKLPSSPEEEGFVRKMELVDGHPICDKCLAGIHDHPSPDEHRGEKRVDCKNQGYIDETDEREYQCHCGDGGQYIDGKWEAWEEE